jgi:curved DNA-binding protein CbpA
LNNKYKKYFEILELDENATFVEVTRAYGFLKKLYSKDNSFTVAYALEDFSVERKEQVLKEIDKAYFKLKEYFLLVKQEAKKELPELSGNQFFSGEFLRKLRKEMAVSVKEISTQTNIRKTYIRAIEEEDFNSLPPAVYTRGFVKAYAEFLGLPSEKVVNDYMKRFKVKE